MSVLAVYPLITTPRLAETRDFYIAAFGFSVVFEASWVVMLSHDGDGISLGLMSPDHPSRPPGPETFEGAGMLVTVQVDDVDKVFDHFATLKAPIEHPLTDEPWGQRRFMTRDPSGTVVDVVQQTEPQLGWWDQYL